MIITTEELKKKIDENDEYILIDVRRDDELVNGMIPTAKHLCMDDVESGFKLDDDSFKEKFGFSKPSKEDLIIVHCRTGARSGNVAIYLRNKGYNVKNYQGSVQAWSLIDNNVKMY